MKKKKNIKRQSIKLQELKTEFPCAKCGIILKGEKQENNQLIFNDVYYYIQVLTILTDGDPVVMSIQKFGEISYKWLFDKGIHLSATELLLIRPDLITDFLLEYQEESGIKCCGWFLSPIILCEKCYREYTKEVPEK